MTKQFPDALEMIRKKDPSYREGAYYFLLEALDFTLTGLDAPRHVSGRELCEGICRCAIQRFGPMSRTVFEHWGIHDTSDFGSIVFQLIEEGILSKTETDSLHDFVDIFDFKTVFEDEYSWTSD